MAEPSGGGGDSGRGLFTILGTVEVDLATLRKSLAAAEGEVHASATRLQSEFNRSAPGAAGADGASPFAGGPTGAPFANIKPIPPLPDPTEKVRHGVHSTGSEFSHLSRIIREVLQGPLAAINPELGHLVGGMAAAARSARFYGAAIGGAIVVVVALTEVIGKYLAAAKEATAATLDQGEALATLDAGRAEAGIKKITEKLAEYQLETDILEGKVDSGFWQKLVAAADWTAEKVTGSLDRQAKAQLDYMKTSVEIGERVTIPKAEAESHKAEAAIMGREGDLALKTATSYEELAAAYSKTSASVRAKTAATKELLDLEEMQEIRKVRNATNTLLAFHADHITDSNRVQTLAKMNEVKEAGMAQEDQIRTRFDLKRKEADDEERQSLAEKAHARAEGMAKQVAEEEQFAQKDTTRRQKAVETASTTAQAVAEAQNKIAAVYREHEGVGEGAAASEERLAASRERVLAPTRSAIESENELYASRRRVLEQNIASGVDSIKSQRELVDLEKEHTSAVLDLRSKLARETADQEVKEVEGRKQRMAQEVEQEDRRAKHAVEVGRKSYEDQVREAGESVTDPRRTLQQREAAEKEHMALRRQYAADSVKLYESTGGGGGQQVTLEVQRGLLGELTSGSKAWYDQVQKVYESYKAINDQARGIFGQMASTAEGEARRRKMKNMGVEDIPDLLEGARQRDSDALGGGRGSIGDISAAMGRLGMWETMQQQDLDPGEAFRRAMQNPRAQTARAAGLPQLGPSDALGSLAGVPLGGGFDRMTDRASALLGSGMTHDQIVEALTRSPQDQLMEGIKSGMGATAQARPMSASELEGTVGSVSKTLLGLIPALSAFGQAVQAASGRGGGKDAIPSSMGGPVVTPADDAALGRNLFLSGNRGPRETESFQ